MRTLRMILCGAIFVLVVCDCLFNLRVRKSTAPQCLGQRRPVPAPSEAFRYLPRAFSGETRMLGENSRAELDRPPLLVDQNQVIEKMGTRARLLASEPHQSFIKVQASSEPLQDFLEKKGYSRIKLNQVSLGYLGARVKINGQRANLLIDTGSPRTYLDELRANILGIKWRRIDDTFPADALFSKAKYSAACALELGGYRIGELQIMSYDLSNINRVLVSRGEVPFDGLLGADILDSALSVIDYKTYYIYVLGGKRGKVEAGKNGAQG